MPGTLVIHCGSSTFSTPLAEVRQWKAVLDCADAISLMTGSAGRERERVHVRLGGLRRWIAFEQFVGGSPYAVIGYQETVGATRRGYTYTGGSNRQVLAWVNGDGAVSIGEAPGITRTDKRSILWMTKDGRTLTGDDVPEVLG